VSHDHTEIIIICVVLNKHFLLLSMLTVVLLNIFVETGMHFFEVYLMY